MSDYAPENDRTRTWLAFGIVILSISLVAIASGIAIGFATDAGRPEMSRLVFASVLPLLGTWVGTVLAYYFVRDNLEAAAKSTRDSIQAAAENTRQTAVATAELVGRPITTPVKEVMIPVDQIDRVTAPPGQDPGDVLLTEVHNAFGSAKGRRIPIFTDSGAVRYVIHDSTFNAFAQSQGVDPSQLTGTVSDLAQAADLGPLIQAIAFVPITATVADARARLGAVQGCNDVFVTASGKNDERAEGWLTNTDLASFE